MTAAGPIVWLASYPKSGNTWLRLLLANLAMPGDAAVDINAIDDRSGLAIARAEFDAETLLNSGTLTADEADLLRPRVLAVLAARTRSPCFVKIHDAWTLTPAGEPLLGRGVARAAIVLVRDPRDIAVSLSYHMGRSIDRTIAFMADPAAAFAARTDRQRRQLRQKLLGWGGHVASWLDQVEVPVHLLRYEDLTRAPVETLAAAAEFAGLAPERKAVERAVRHAAFVALQAQERARGFRERPKRMTAFFRRGRAGAWTDELDATQARAIVEEHHSIMDRLGYDIEWGSTAPESPMASARLGLESEGAHGSERSI